MTDSNSSSTHRRAWGPWIRVIVAMIVMALLGYVLWRYPVADWVSASLAWVKGLGAMGFVFFVAIYIVATVIGVPAWILTVGAGAAWGVITGTLVVIVGATAGVTGAFLVGRYLARGMVARKVENNARFAAIDRAVAQRGFRIVLLTRLSPVFPYNLMNYMYGITSVTLRAYVVASFIGMIPGTVMYVYFGSIGHHVASGAPSTIEQSIVKYAGFVIAIAVTIYVARVARKALREVEVTE